MSCFGGFFINVRKNVTFKIDISYSFVGICDIYLENSLLNFNFGFDIEKNFAMLYLYKYHVC